MAAGCLQTRNSGRGASQKELRALMRWIWTLGTAFLLLMGQTGLSGCAPKRVAASGVVITAPGPDAPSPRSATAEEPAVRSGGPNSSPTADRRGDLPEPAPLARSGTSRTAPAAGAAVPLGRQAVDLAKAQLGKPYQWGAAGPDKFDCSGLVQYVYSNLGVSLPRVSRQQAERGQPVGNADLQPGDLVFFRLSGSRVDHVGIYVGKQRFIHAPNRHSPVRTDSLNDSWWRGKFVGGRRVG